MPLKVVSFATYLTTGDTAWRDEDHSASQFIKAIKGNPFNGYGHVPVCGQSRLLDQSNAQAAIGWFGEIAAAYLDGKLSADSVLVPIPNSDCAVDAKVTPRTTLLAEAICGHFNGVKILDCLRWKSPMTPSSKGGTRNPQQLYENLAVTRKVENLKLVLIDDVRTTGAHLHAAKARLIAKGARSVVAVCAGRTVLAPETDAFAALEERLDDFVPGSK